MVGRSVLFDHEAVGASIFIVARGHPLMAPFHFPERTLPEPTSTTSAAAGMIAGNASTITLALLGVDYYSLIWSMVGTLLALYQAEKMGRWRSIFFVVLSTLIGAALGTLGAAVVAYFVADDKIIAAAGRPLLMGASLLAGFGAQLIVTALLRAGLSRIDRLGGAQGNSQTGGQ